MLYHARLFCLAVLAVAWTSFLVLNGQSSISKKPEVLVVVHMAARNDLFPYAGRNIKHLQTCSSSSTVKIFIRLDMKKPHQPCVTKYFFIDNNKVMQVGDDVNLDSGDEKSLIHTVQIAYERFPADELILILWNHGYGAIEPSVQKAINPSELFRYNSKKGIIELDRSVGFMDYISKGETSFQDPKSICFDDISGNYLTIPKLTHALEVISRDILRKKIKILACDACLMGGADVFIGWENYIEYYVASQEEELGTGYRYDLLLEPLMQGKYRCDKQFARHFVKAFKDAYDQITQDYTQAAIDMSCAYELGKNIDSVASLLIMGLEKQKGKTVKEAIRISRHKHHCTRFGEPSYIDLGNFYDNLLKNCPKCELETPESSALFRAHLSDLLKKGTQLMQKAVIANTTGKNLHRATGISIHFPEFVIHKSYHHNMFATSTHWLPFLKKYLGRQ